MSTATLDFAQIGRQLMHPIQRKILERMSRLEGNGGISPNLLARDLGEPLGNVSYHMSVLAGHKKSKFRSDPLVKLVRTEPRRGAVEHFYALAA